MPPPIAIRHEAVKSAVVKVECGTNFGAGFFISPNHILTCVHTLVPHFFRNAGVRVHWNGVQCDANVVDSRPLPSNEVDGVFPDVALLTTTQNFNPPVTLWVDGDVQPTDEVKGFGFSVDTQTVPLDMDAVVAAFQMFGTGYSLDQELIRLNHGQFQPGMSGGPLWNARTGRVCGLITRSRNRDSDLGGFAVQGRAIRYHFDALRLQIDGAAESGSSVPGSAQVAASVVIAPSLGSTGAYVESSAAHARRGEILHILSKIDFDAQSPPLVPELVYVVLDPVSASARRRFDEVAVIARRHGYIAVNAQDFGDKSAGTTLSEALIAQANLVIFDFAADASNATVFQQLGYLSALNAAPEGVLVTSAATASLPTTYPVELGVNDVRFSSLVDMRLKVLEPRPPRHLSATLLEISFVSELEMLARSRGARNIERNFADPSGGFEFDLLVDFGKPLGVDIHRVSPTNPMPSIMRAIKEAEATLRKTDITPVVVLIGQPAKAVRAFNETVYWAKVPVLVGTDVQHLKGNPIAMEVAFALADGLMEPPSTSTLPAS